ncbi:hypothetical protein ABBQ32_006162 [Trebouxia sp. C0010 RCD-2024]
MAKWALEEVPDIRLPKRSRGPGSNAHLEAYLKAAPLLEIQVGLVKETWSRKTSLCATSSVRPVPKAPLFHNSGLTMFDSYFEARLQAAPLLLEILGLASKHGIERIGFWEVVGGTAAQHVLWLAARKLLVN